MFYLFGSLLFALAGLAALLSMANDVRHHRHAMAIAWRSLFQSGPVMRAPAPVTRRPQPVPARAAAA